MWPIIARRFRWRSARGKSGEVYNIGGNSETTNIDIVRALCALVDEYLAERADLRQAFPASPAAAGKRALELITHVRDRPGHDRRYAIDYRKARRELGYAPSRDLAQGLRETLDWYVGQSQLVAGAPGARLRGVGREELQALMVESVKLPGCRGDGRVARTRGRIYNSATAKAVNSRQKVGP